MLVEFVECQTNVHNCQRYILLFMQSVTPFLSSTLLHRFLEVVTFRETYVDLSVNTADCTNFEKVITSWK